MRHVFYSNRNFPVNSIDERKCGQFRLRKNQLERQNLTVCEIVLKDFKFVKKSDKFKFIEERIRSSV